jgi:hypothetical protein
MHPHSRSPRTASPVRCALVLALCLSAGDALTPPARAKAVAHGRPAAPTVWTNPVVAQSTKWTWRKLYAPLESGLASRRRMLQFGIIGMCLALYIIVWRK